MASFSLAVDRDFKDKTTGERACDWIDVVAWRQTGEFAARYLTKGRMVVVEGRLQMRDYTARDGSKRRAAEVVADSVYFADSRQTAPPPSEGNACEAALPEGPSNELRDLDDDGELPF